MQDNDKLSVCAKMKNAHISMRKVCIVANKIKNIPVMRALDVLSFATQRSAALLKKVIESAIANAKHNHQLDVEMLKVSTILLGRGSNNYKRMMPRARGAMHMIRKSSTHITVFLSWK